MTNDFGLGRINFILSYLIFIHLRGGLLSVPNEKLITPESVAERKASSRGLPRHPPAGTLIVDIDGLVWCARLAPAEGKYTFLTVSPPHCGMTVTPAGAPGRDVTPVNPGEGRRAL